MDPDDQPADKLDPMFGQRRNIKVLWVSTSVLLHTLMSPIVRRGKYVSAMVVEGLPESELKVLNVTYDAIANRVGFLLEHHSFPSVADGACAPELDIHVRSMDLRLTEEQVARLVMDKMVRL